ncbi:MAG: cupin domain-containing protein [Candidatus Omnitrophota bacterium]
MNKKKALKPISVKLEGDKRYQRLLGGIPDTLGMKSGHVTLKPGESVGVHTTGEKEEAIIVLKGKGEIYCSGIGPVIAQENTLVYIPPDTEHNVKNVSSGILRYVYVVSPANPVRHKYGLSGGAKNIGV